MTDRLDELAYILKKQKEQLSKDEALKYLKQQRIKREMASNRPIGYCK